jgi:hypothetical protein
MSDNLKPKAKSKKRTSRVLNNAVMSLSSIAPSRRASLVTPHDTNLLPNAGLKGWSVNEDGNVKLLLSRQLLSAGGPPDDSLAITVAAKAGVRYPDEVIKIFATGTTATGINVYW